MSMKILLSILAVFVIGGGSYLAYEKVLCPCARLDEMCATATHGGNTKLWGVCMVVTAQGYRNSRGKCQEALDAIAVWKEVNAQDIPASEKKRLLKLMAK